MHIPNRFEGIKPSRLLKFAAAGGNEICAATSFGTTLKPVAFSSESPDELVQLISAPFPEPRPDVQLNAEGNRIKNAVRTVAIACAQIHKTGEIVIESEVYPVVPGQARAPFN
jgi:hypothetical protein